MTSIKTIFIFVILIMAFNMRSQTDSAVVEGVKDKKAVYSNARKATIMSAIIPGLGQIYNRKYWKAPVIYAGMGALGYMFITNNNEYNFYRKHLIAEYDEDPSTLNTSGYNGTQLQTQKVYYRRYRDFAAIGIGALYILNIIDANVDAHLKTFDVSDDLSLNIDPWQGWHNGSAVTGISLKINFK